MISQKKERNETTHRDYPMKPEGLTAPIHQKWTRQKPTVAGAYWVRGWSIGAPSRQALVEVCVSDEEGEILCNLHGGNSDEFAFEPVVDYSDDFEWFGPLSVAVQPAPAIDLSSIDPEWIKYAALMLRQDSDATDERCAVELDRLLALIDGQAKLQASLNEQFGIPEELRTAIRGFIAASWMPSKEESTEEMRVTYSYWHKRLVKAVGAMGYVEAEEIAMQPTKGEGE